MKTLHELMNMALEWVEAYACFETSKGNVARDNFYEALTTTLAEKDARIAELERDIHNCAEQLGFARNQAEELERYIAPHDDDRRRFADECAMRIYVPLHLETRRHLDADPNRNAQRAYDAAEALAAERDRRMQG